MSVRTSDIIALVYAQPGLDAEDVANHFGITSAEAVEAVGDLLDKGKIGYTEQ